MTYSQVLSVQYMYVFLYCFISHAVLWKLLILFIYSYEVGLYEKNTEHNQRLEFYLVQDLSLIYVF